MDNPFDMILQKLEQMDMRIQQLTSASVNTPVQTLSKEEPGLTAQEIADYLKCKKSTVLRYKRNGVLSYYQAGRKILFKKSEVDAALTSMKKKGARA